MRMRKTFQNRAEASEYYLEESEFFFNSVLKKHVIDTDSLSKMEIAELEEKELLIHSLLKNKQFIGVNSRNYINDKDFKLIDTEDNFHGFRFRIDSKLQRSLFYLHNRKDQLVQETSVNSIKKLVRNLPETDTKTKIEVEIDELKSKYDEVNSSISFDNQQYIQVIELEKHKADMLDKKTDIWLKFLAKESIASILGGILLIFLGMSIIIAMLFFDREPAKIVETSFLLILGYFFGQSFSKSKE